MLLRKQPPEKDGGDSEDAAAAGGRSSSEGAGDNSSSEEDETCVCEVCGSSFAAAVMLRCKHYDPQSHCVGIHTFCLPHRTVRLLTDDFTCVNCNAFARRAAAALEEAADTLRSAKGQSTAPELMPDIRALPGQPRRVRHPSDIKLQPTQQQRINAARAAAAAAAGGAANGGSGSSSGYSSDDDDDDDDEEEEDAIRKPASTPATRGRGRQAKRLKLDPAAERAGPSKPAAAARAAAGADAKGRGSRAGSAAAAAAAANGAATPARGCPARAAAAAAAGKQQQHQPQQLDAQALKTYKHVVLNVAISCQLLLSGVQPGLEIDPAEAQCYLDCRGVIKRSKEAERQAEPAQQAAHKELLLELAELANSEGPRFKELCGGVLDLALHPSVGRFAADAAASYRPLLLVPHSEEDRQAIRELLWDAQRFAVMSVGQRLLVLLPRREGELVALCTRRRAAMDDLAREVVASIMNDSAVVRSQGDGGAASESLHGAAAGEEAERQEADRAGSGAAAAAAAAAAAGGAGGAGNAAGAGQQRRQQKEEALAVGSAIEAAADTQQQPLGPLPVRQLPAGMSVAPTRFWQRAAKAAAGEAAASPAGDAEMPDAPAGASPAPTATPARAGSGAALPSLQQVVDGTPLARLLAALRDPEQRRYSQLQLLLAGMLPQLHDLCPVQQLRLFVVGWTAEQLEQSPHLAACLHSARGLVAELHTAPGAMQTLLQQLGLQAAAAQAEAEAAAATPGGLGGRGGGKARTPASAAAGVRVKQEPGASPMQVDFIDLTQDADSSGSCQHVLLLPTHMGSAQLQAALGALPLWQLLASPVAIFRQGLGSGLLQWLHSTAQQQQEAGGQGEQQQAAAAGHAPPQCLPDWLQCCQLHAGGVAVVCNTTSLAGSSKQQVQQLLDLLQQGGRLQQRQQQRCGPWQLCLSQLHLDTLPASRKALLQDGLQDGRVVPLDLALAPGSLREQEAPGALPANTASLAAQQQDARLVLMVVPDLVQQQEPRRGASGTPGAAATPPAGALAGATPGSAGGQRSKPLDPALQHLAHQALLLGCQQRQVLAGTMSQALAFLSCIVLEAGGSNNSSSSQEEGDTDGSSGDGGGSEDDTEEADATAAE